MGFHGTCRFRRALVVATATVALAVASACGTSMSGTRTAGTTESSSTGSGISPSSAVDQAKAVIDKYSVATTSYPEVDAVSGDVSRLKAKTVWFVPIGASVPSLKLYGDAMGEALKNVGAQVHICDGKFVPTSIAACLEQAGTSGADAVVTAYVDYQLVPSAVDALVKKGIPVLMAGTVPPQGKKNTPQLAFDDTTKTQDLMEEIVASAVIVDSNGKAKILYIGVTDSPNVREVGDHAVAYISSKCPSCTVTRIDYNTASLAKLPTQVSAALIKAPHTNYIVTQVDPATQGAIAGAQSAGRVNEIKFASTGGDLAALQDIKDGGHQFAELGTSSVYFGWRLADDIIRMATGTVPATDAYSLRLFTKNNVQDLDLSAAGFASQAWYGNDSFEGIFLKAWRVK